MKNYFYLFPLLLVSFPEKKLNYKFKCGSKKKECKVSISKNYLRINKSKIKRGEITNINNKLLCKNEFGISKCSPQIMKNIEYQKYQIEINKAI